MDNLGKVTDNNYNIQYGRYKAQVMNQHIDKHGALRDDGNYNVDNIILEIEAVGLDKIEHTFIEFVKSDNEVSIKFWWSIIVYRRISKSIFNKKNC